MPPSVVPPPVAPLTGYFPTRFTPYCGMPYVTLENFHEDDFIHQIPVDDRVVFLGDSLALHHV